VLLSAAEYHRLPAMLLYKSSLGNPDLLNPT